MNEACGKSFVYGDNVDTDVIIPARYLNTPDAKALAEHCMEDIDATFTQNVEPGDLICAGWNFGCGSSREHAPLAIKASGIKAVIAKSFARIFFRNAININPNYTLAYFNLGRAYQAIGDKALAAEYYQMTMDLNKITEELSDKEVRQRLYDLFE